MRIFRSAPPAGSRLLVPALKSLAAVKRTPKIPLDRDENNLLEPKQGELP